MGTIEPYMVYSAVGLAVGGLMVALVIAARFPSPLAPPMEKVHATALTVFNWGSLAVFGLLGLKMLK